MNMCPRICIVVLSAGAVCPAAYADDWDSAFSKLENWERSFTRTDLQQAVEAIRAQSVVGDRGVWQRLEGVLTNERLPEIVRAETLRLACEKADRAIAREIVSVVSSWVRDLKASEQVVQQLLEDQSLAVKLKLIYVFLADGVAPLERVIDDQTLVLDLLSIIVTETVCSTQASNQAMERIRSNRAPLEVRRAYVLRIIARTPSQAAVEKPLIELVDSSCFPKLRQLVRQSKDADHFHFHAAAVLADLGDTEILADLKEWHPRLMERSANIAQYVEGYIRKIELQVSPDGLLAYIGSTDGWRARVWAIEKAVERGIPKADIRGAILEHSKQVEEGNKRMLQSGLFDIKRVGIGLGVLDPGDLPDVKVPSTKD